jgi:excisionase family DNA binding protein
MLVYHPSLKVNTRMTSSIQPLLLRPSEVARLLAVSRSRTYEMIARGELPGIVRIGRSVRVSRQALVDWIDRQAAEPTGDSALASTSNVSRQPSRPDHHHLRDGAPGGELHRQHDTRDRVGS